MYIYIIYITSLPILSFKVVHISTANVSSMVTDRVNITNVVTQEIPYSPSDDIFTLHLGPK